MSSSHPPGPPFLLPATAAATCCMQWTWQHLPQVHQVLPGLQHGKPGCEESTPPGTALTNRGQEPVGKQPPLPCLQWTLVGRRGADYMAPLKTWRDGTLGSHSSDQLLLHSAQPSSSVLCDYFLQITTYTQTLLSHSAFRGEPDWNSHVRQFRFYPSGSQRQHIFGKSYLLSSRKQQEAERGEQTQQNDGLVKVPILLSPHLSHHHYTRKPPKNRVQEKSIPCLLLR